MVEAFDREKVVFGFFFRKSSCRSQLRFLLAGRHSDNLEFYICSFTSSSQLLSPCKCNFVVFLLGGAAWKEYTGNIFSLGHGAIRLIFGRSGTKLMSFTILKSQVPRSA